MSRIAFVTSEQMPDMNPREAGVIAKLRSEGHEVVPYIWSRPEHEARSYDLIVIRSPWDYYQRLDEFLSWIDRLPERGVHNPKPILKWNIDKRYLRELEAKGVRVVPTTWTQAGNAGELAETLRRSAWPEMVMKPVRSAGAYKTVRLQRGELPDLSPFLGIDLTIQPMMSEILTEGEWSLLYFGGEFSHAVLKQPKEGDFRVQYTHGGEETRVSPPAELRKFGDQVLAALGQTLLYARVDFVRSRGKCLLMELELLEPNLFLDVDPEAPARFARALNRFIG